MSFDPATIAAFVDGELDDLTARRIEREAEHDRTLAAEIARHQALKARLSAHYAPVAEEAVPERLRALLIDPKIDASLSERREAKRARFAPAHWGAIAASLVLGLTIGLRPWVPAPDVTSASGHAHCPGLARRGARYPARLEPAGRCRGADRAEFPRPAGPHLPQLRGPRSGRHRVPRRRPLGARTRYGRAAEQRLSSSIVGCAGGRRGGDDGGRPVRCGGRARSAPKGLVRLSFPSR